MSEPLLGQLVRTLARPIGESDRQRARLHLLDWLACVAGARESAVAGALNPMQSDRMRNAAFLGNVLEMDDIHRTALLHPGPVIWPCALIEDFGDLNAVLDAAITGYEVMIAVGATFDARHYRFYHPTTTAGVFGTAATFAKGWNFAADKFASALALAGSVSGGLWQMRLEPVTAKQWHAAHALNTGRAAAEYAGHGITGPLSVLEGPLGLHAATCAVPKPMTFPDQWRIHEVSFKPWAACRHAHAAIDCALTLRAAGKLTAPFHVETYADALAFCDRADPVTEGEAKFSLQHAVAVIADGRDAAPADFTLDAIAALAPLRAQVTVAAAPEITARYPAHFGARVNGFELVDARGDPERPVSEADIVAKMHALAAWGGLRPEAAERATELALRGNDAAAISAMLGEWLA